MTARITRRGLLVGTSALLASSAAIGGPRRPAFVRAEAMRFAHEGAPYRVAGTNMWYAAYLGADAPVGDRDRLKRELDRLAALDVNNIRILGSSETASRTFSPHATQISASRCASGVIVRRSYR